MSPPSLSSCPVCLGRVAADMLSRHMAGHSKEEILAALISREGQPAAQQLQQVQQQPAVQPAAASSSGLGLHFLASAAAATAQQNPLSQLLRPVQQAQPAAATRPAAAPAGLLPLALPPPPPMPSTSSVAPQQSTAPTAPVMSPLFMPQMMGMMQVMSSPCLIPQPNGPPLLVNMPSYIYPGMLPAAGATAANMSLQPSGNLMVGPSGAIVASPQASTASPMVSLQASPKKRSTSSSSSTFTSSSIVPTPRPRSPSQRQPSFPTEPVPLSESAMSEIASKRTSSETSVSSAVNVEASKGEASTSSTRSTPRKPSSPIPGPSRCRKASGPLKLKIKNRRDPVASTSKSQSRTVQDTLLSEESASVEQNPLLSSSSPLRPSSRSSSSNRAGAESGTVYGFTQYADDSPYPAASLNFSSMLLEQQPQPGTSSNTASSQPAKPSSSVALSGLLSPKLERAVSGNAEGGKVCTVQTVADLQNALKSDDDVQIVVPNELLETTEFKSFLSGLNSFPLHETSASTSSGNGGLPCAVPPNTPNTTRPPSAAAAAAEDEAKLSSPVKIEREDEEEDERMSSPQPCSSKGVRKKAPSTDMSNLPILPSNMSGHESDEDEDEDDITLKDLVSLETMEDVDVCEDEDQFFTLSSNTNPLEPFMNSILQAPESGGFSCDKCGLHFGSMLEYREHREVCFPTKKGSKKAKGSARHKAKNSAAAAAPRPPPASEDANDSDAPAAAAKMEDADLKESVGLEMIKTEAEIKSELLDSNSQPVLGGLAEEQRWKCNQCRAVFATGPQLLEHLEQVRAAEHKCAACHVIFDDRKLFLLHRRKFHPAAPKIKTEPSEASSASSSRLLAESLLPNENGEFVCDKCDRSFKDRELLIKHASCHDEERPFECLECGKKFGKASLLRDHRRRHFEVGQFECEFCRKRFYTPNKLREHIRVHTGESPLACNVCGKTFKRHSNLSEHKRIHQENRPAKPPKELFCHCGKVFKTQRDLDWHREGEHDRQPKKCNYCGEVFVHSSSLTRHVRLKHESNFLPKDKKQNLYAKCPICAQTFYKTSINKHIRIKHQGQKPYRCDVCSASFVTKCNLLNHQWQHRGVRARPFKCQLCSKAYLRQALLDAHMRSHRGVKPFVCNECGLQFANKSNWQRHVAEHSGARNYECPHCHKRFSRGYYLTDHLKVHTGEKPYVCGICGKMAATRSNYNSHLRTHITREPVNSEV